MSLLRHSYFSDFSNFSSTKVIQGRIVLPGYRQIIIWKITFYLCRLLFEISLRKDTFAIFINRDKNFIVRC